MPPIPRRLQLSILPQHFAILRFAATTPTPAWAEQGAFLSVTRTSEELSIVAPAGIIPDEFQPQATWRVLKVHGPFALSEIGVLAALATPLADAKISLFVISTFDTDYLLVTAAQLPSAVATLERAGHKIQQSGAHL